MTLPSLSTNTIAEQLAELLRVMASEVDPGPARIELIGVDPSTGRDSRRTRHKAP
ncbi:MAG: hypothetical protein LC798_13570 [Chloroflexi bacterium]|nr:hypothetical protein [Chloroflexota bacterium]